MGAGLAAAAAIAATLALVLPPVLAPAAQPTLAAVLTPTDPDVPVQASIELTSFAWGTRIDMDCSYHPGRARDRTAATPRSTYAMWVVDRDGMETPLSTWTAAPDGTVSVTAGTALDARRHRRDRGAGRDRGTGPARAPSSTRPSARLRPRRRRRPPRAPPPSQDAEVPPDRDLDVRRPLEPRPLRDVRVDARIDRGDARVHGALAPRGSG